jgi:hypothetical protein
MADTSLGVFRVYIAFFLEESVDLFVTEMIKRKYRLDPLDSVNNTFVTTSPGNMTTLFAAKIEKIVGENSMLVSQILAEIAECLSTKDVKYHCIVVVDSGIFPTSTWAAGNIISADRISLLATPKPSN